MAKSQLRAMLNSRQGRKLLLKKIEKGSKDSYINERIDPEVNAFQREMIQNWNKLDQYEPVKNDLVNVPEEKKEEEITRIKEQFIEWCCADLTEVYNYAIQKKEQIKDSLSQKFKFRKEKNE